MKLLTYFSSLIYKKNDFFLVNFKNFKKKMLCSDCKKEIPFSPYIIRCKKCYAVMKQGSPINKNNNNNNNNNSWKKSTMKEPGLTEGEQMKCLDCDADIPQSTYFVRCKPCFSKMKKLET